MAWTTYAKDQMFACGLGLATPPSVFYLALYSGSANPAGPPVELTLAGYGRQAVAIALASGSTSLVVSSADTTFGPISTGGSYLGVALLDNIAGGNTWFWQDEASAQTILAGSAVDFPAGSVQIQRT